jgi:hypothetical protein
MDNPFAETRLCRKCDLQWVSSDPACWNCGRDTPRQVGIWALDDPITVPRPNNLGMSATHFESSGLGD